MLNIGFIMLIKEKIQDTSLIQITCICYLIIYSYHTYSNWRIKCIFQVYFYTTKCYRFELVVVYFKCLRFIGSVCLVCQTVQYLWKHSSVIFKIWTNKSTVKRVQWIYLHMCHQEINALSNKSIGIKNQWQFNNFIQS